MHHESCECGYFGMAGCPMGAVSPPWFHVSAYTRERHNTRQARSSALGYRNPRTHHPSSLLGQQPSPSTKHPQSIHPTHYIDNHNGSHRTQRRNVPTLAWSTQGRLAGKRRFARSSAAYDIQMDTSIGSGARPQVQRAAAAGKQRRRSGMWNRSGHGNTSCDKDNRLYPPGVDRDTGSEH